MKTKLRIAIGALAVAALAGNISAQPLPFTVTDFENPAWLGNPVMLQEPGFSGSTGAKIAAGSTSAVTATFPTGNPGAGDQVLQLDWIWNADATTPHWARVTTFNAPEIPNPTISFLHPLSFDLYTNRDIEVSLLVRQTETTADFGANGGAAGGITILGGSTSSGKVVPAGEWVTLVFDIPNESRVAFTGDGGLAGDRGVLEALGIIAQGGIGPENPYTVYVDNFVIVPEPSTVALGILGGFALLIGYMRRRR
jgi:hypothetical protein